MMQEMISKLPGHKYLLQGLLMGVVALTAVNPLAADDDRFAHPLRIDSADLYTMVRIFGGGVENRESASYARTRYLRFAGEYRFLDWMSVNASFGRSVYDRTGAGQLWQYDRLGLGVKAGTKFNLGVGLLALSGGLKIFDRIRSPGEREGIDNELLLLRGNIAGALRFGSLEIGVNVRVESETNEGFKERFDQEFRRHILYGLSVSYAWTDSLRIFAETEYREPENIAVDDTRFWLFYPGVDWALTSAVHLRASFVVPVRKGFADKGLEVGILFYFD